MKRPLDSDKSVLFALLHLYSDGARDVRVPLQANCSALVDAGSNLHEATTGVIQIGESRDARHILLTRWLSSEPIQYPQIPLVYSHRSKTHI